MGSGGAVILARGFPKGTTDIDAIPKGISPTVLDPLVKELARELNLEPDWLNPYFSSFSNTLPLDYADRLVEAHHDSNLEVQAQGKVEMLIEQKIFAMPER